MLPKKDMGYDKQTENHQKVNMYIKNVYSQMRLECPISKDS